MLSQMLTGIIAAQSTDMQYIIFIEYQQSRYQKTL